MKLELKHIIPYLLHNLKALSIDGFSVSVLGVDFTTNRILNINGDRTFTIPEIKPLLRPLSGLTKEIEINGKKFVPIDELELEQCELGVNSLGVILFQKSNHEFIYASDIYNQVLQRLFEWHFDVFGLIDEGLALPLI